METDALFQARLVGTMGHEIIDPQGTVIAWTVNEPWAAIIVALLTEHTSINAACFFLSGSDRFEGVRAMLPRKWTAPRRCIPV
jgi:hypothetical protein